MTFRETVRRLEAGLAECLPGAVAQQWMSPRPERERPHDANPARLRHASGLVLIAPRDDRAHVVLTVRTHRLGRHGGQVSLPGGVVDPGETFEQAAVREAHEEIGLATDLVRQLGALTPVDIVVSGFRLHPIAAAARARPIFRPSDLEVARILEVPLDTLMAPETIRRRTLVRDGHTIVAPSFTVDGLPVWGATAMILAELLSLLGWTGPPPEQSR